MGSALQRQNGGAGLEPNRREPGYQHRNSDCRVEDNFNLRLLLLLPLLLQLPLPLPLDASHLLEQGLLNDEKPADPIGYSGQVRQEGFRVEVFNISGKRGKKKKKDRIK